MNRGLLVVFLFVLLFVNDVVAQSSKKKSPYNPRFKLDFPIAVGSGIGLGMTRYLKTKIQPLTLSEIAVLDRKSIPGFDRGVTYFWKPKLSTWSDVTALTTMAAPLVLLLDEGIREDYGTVMLLGVETFLINDFVTQSVKISAKRNRPYLYNSNPQISDNLKTDRDGRMSFFSSHMSHASAISFFTAKVYSDYNKESKLKPIVWTVAALLPAVTGYLRYRSGEHYPSDIFVGYLLGAGVGWLVPTLHKKKMKK